MDMIQRNGIAYFVQRIPHTFKYALVLVLLMNISGYTHVLFDQKITHIHHFCLLVKCLEPTNQDSQCFFAMLVKQIPIH